MVAWEHGGGFSVHAEVRIEAQQRDGLERLLRYCARAAFALERLRAIDPEHLVYASIKPGPSGSVSLLLTPLIPGRSPWRARPAGPTGTALRIRPAHRVVGARHDDPSFVIGRLVPLAVNSSHFWRVLIKVPAAETSD